MLRLSKGDRLTGALKASAEDFIVEEITQNGTVLSLKEHSFAELGLKGGSGSFAVFVMRKRNWNTIQALKELARASGRGAGSIGFAGTKDRVAVTTQLCSIFGAQPERLEETHVKDVEILGAWKSSSGVRLGELLGNRFDICIRTEDNDPLKLASTVNSELNGMFPNYYGEQRFGTRNSNVQIGLHMLKGELEDAAMLFLTSIENEELQESVSARSRLAEEGNFAKALEYFPRYLKYERTMLASLSTAPTDFAKAFRSLPRQLLLMFVHSVESHIFNLALEERIKSGEASPRKGAICCTANFYGFPDTGKASQYDQSKKEPQFELGNIIGYTTNSSAISDFEKGEMEKLGISAEDFRVRRIPEANSKGAYRPLFAPYKDYIQSASEGALRLAFSLPAGSYATSLLNEFVERSSGPQEKDE
jgi:tRNA pseudouridine13 synthase